MGRWTEGPAIAVPPLTLKQLKVFYTAEYPKLIKILVFLDATVEEAEDAAQKAMADFAKRSKAAGIPDHPASYVRRAAVRLFHQRAPARAGSASARDPGWPPGHRGTS